MPKPPLLWPERKRCCICRKKFRWTVLYQRYCSYQCAGVAEPHPYAFPRCCFRKREPGELVPVPKTTFFSLEEAMASHGARRDPRLEAYWCRHCHMVHLGHSKESMSKVEVIEDDPVAQFVPDDSYHYDWMFIQRRRGIKNWKTSKRRRKPPAEPPPYPKEYRRM